MPRSHGGEGAMITNIDDMRRLQIRQNSPKKVGKCGHVKKIFYNSSTMFYDAFRLS